MRGRCAKIPVVALLFARNGCVYIGRNDCRNAQPQCPRAPGEGYEKCVTICRQDHHAEIGALNAAGEHADGGVMFVSYTHCCADCIAAMNAAGVARVFCTGQLT